MRNFSISRRSLRAVRFAASGWLTIGLLLGIGACHDDLPNAHPIAGSIEGLNAPGLRLQNNGGDDVTVAAYATSFRFPTRMASSARYHVTIAEQPDGLTCTVANGTGAARATVANIRVTCSPNAHTIAGSITGLTAPGLVLQNNGVGDLVVAADDTAFEFASPVASGGAYDVTVVSQPAGLTCSVSHGAGENVRIDITSILITCSTTQASIGGAITGLSGSGLVLQNNGVDDLSVTASATTFEFATPVAVGAAYAVTVLTQPTGQRCSINGGTAYATTPVTTIAVACADVVTYTVTAIAGANGSVSPIGAVVVNESADQSFLATPIAGYEVAQWMVDGTPVQSGGGQYVLTNVSSDHTVEAMFAQATLTSSVMSLAIAVNDPGADAALTGNARQIVISNTGSIAATNVSLGYPTWPAGTTASSTCGSILAPAASCTITITPGTTPTSGCTDGSAPTAGRITASADNASDTQIDVVVLGYGCLYQGGFLYAVDDTTPTTGSIGGAVLSPVDQVADPLGGYTAPGIAWSSTSMNAYDGGVSVWGIDQTSTAVSPSPNASTTGAPATKLAGQEDCRGGRDGACNTENILTWYSAPNTNPSVDPSFYAAGTCQATINGHADWYLPAICELGPDSGNNICPTGASTVQNVVSHLSMLIENACSGAACLRGEYWSSTQEAARPSFSAPDAPRVTAWTQYFSAAISAQGAHGKGDLYGIRCARALTD
ncbi:MAG: hypothetical protein SXG53_22330 [Pseudomonadota bacterium]|nr:hypothetical protein [Pseudomonadota bacterium]